MIELVIEQSGTHKRKHLWNKIERPNFELLMAGTLLRTACSKGNLEFKVFLQALITKALDWQKCFVFNCLIAKLHQTLLFGRV